MSAILTKNFDEPDELVALQNVAGQILVLGDVHIARYIYQPGWQWSRDIQPTVGTPSCQFHHQGVVLSGRIEFIMDDGSQRVAVHIAARIAGLAGAGEVLVSASAVGLLEGAGLDFTSAGEHELRGVTGRRALCRLAAEV